MSEKEFKYIAQAVGSKNIYYYPSYATLKDSFMGIEKIIRRDGKAVINENIKQNKSEYLISLGVDQFVVEHHRIRKLGKYIKHKIRDPAKKLWDNANMLLKHEIPIVELVALIQEFSFGFPKNEFMISKCYNGINGDDYFSSDSLMKSHWELAINQILKLAQKLKNARITHDYFRSSNILMVNHQPLLMGFQYVNKFEGDEKAFQIEHRFDVDFFSRYLRFSPEAQKLFDEIRAHQVPSLF